MKLIVITRTRILFDALHSGLVGQHGIDQMAVARRIGEAFNLLSKQSFDVCLVDFDLPGVDTVVMDLSETWPAMRIIGIVGGLADDRVALGARCERLQRQASLNDVATLLSRDSKPEVLAGLAEDPPAAAGQQLTMREIQVAKLIADGLDNKSIARKLSIKPSTVKNHVHNILVTLEISSRTQVAGRLGWLTSTPK